MKNVWAGFTDANCPERPFCDVASTRIFGQWDVDMAVQYSDVRGVRRGIE